MLELMLYSSRFALVSQQINKTDQLKKALISRSHQFPGDCAAV